MYAFISGAYLNYSIRFHWSRRRHYIAKSVAFWGTM